MQNNKIITSLHLKEKYRNSSYRDFGSHPMKIRDEINSNMLSRNRINLTGEKNYQYGGFLIKGNTN